MSQLFSLALAARAGKNLLWKGGQVEERFGDNGTIAGGAHARAESKFASAFGGLALVRVSQDFGDRNSCGFEHNAGGQSMSFLNRFRSRPKSKQARERAPFIFGSGTAPGQAAKPEGVPLTVQDILDQVSERALVRSGDDTLVVNGFKAAEIVKKNIRVAKEAYEQLFHHIQARIQERACLSKEEWETVLVLNFVLTALAGGLGNVTGDNSYVRRLVQLALPR